MAGPLARRRLVVLTAGDVLAAICRWQADGVSVPTVSARWLVVRSATSWAVGERLLRTNPLAGVKGPPGPHPAATTLSPMCAEFSVLPRPPSSMPPANWSSTAPRLDGSACCSAPSKVGRQAPALLLPVEECIEVISNVFVLEGHGVRVVAKSGGGIAVPEASLRLEYLASFDEMGGHPVTQPMKGGSVHSGLVPQATELV